MPRNAIAYDDDFFTWTQEQARLLRDGEFADIDVENLAEEVESMGRSVRRGLRNRLTILLMHLLKWRYQPMFRSRSWSGTIREQRAQAQSLMDESPSLSSLLADQLSEIYASALTKAAGETGFAETGFPITCPFTPEQILSEDFLPED
ncbi:MAG TPA: DUF29 domain-containing protein [Stellaceae bacterium]|nr:DUF29 domain-containing protein [Stellaceae bacterium]